MKILTYWWQGLKYASMSIFAIYAGYVIQAKTLFSLDLLVLIVPALASIIFFMCYAQRFDPKNSKTSDNEKESSEWLRAALLTFTIGTILFAVIVYLITKTLPIGLIIAFVIQASMYAYYGYFLLNRLSENSKRVLRHQLFWSVVLSIGFGMYYGYTFSRLSDPSLPLLPLIPVGAITLIYIIDRLLELERRKFVKGMSVIFLTLTILMILANTVIIVPYELGENFSTMLICVAVSIYMAVFEAWVVTSEITKKRVQYSAATLGFLILIIWSFPVLFIFSPYGGYFLIGFGVHAFLSFSIWYVFGRRKYMKRLHWRYVKTAMVLSFLVFLVSTKSIDEQPTDHFIAELVSLSAVFGFGICALYSVKKLFNTEYLRKTNPLRILIERINFVRILSGVSFIAYVGLYLSLTLLTSNKNSALYYRGEMTLCFYAIAIVLCGLIVIWHDISFFTKPLIKQMTNVIRRYVVGLLSVARVVPSTLLALAVALPSAYNGIGFWRSCFSALPFFLSAIGAFALNDYYDVEKDKINKPYRAIPSGKLPVNLVLFFSLTSISLAFLATFIFSRTKIEFILYMICISGMASYNFFVKYLSLSKTFLTAMISSLPLLFSVMVFEYPLIYSLLPIAACCFILGREWLMDIRDVKGDSKGQIVTIPMIIGPAATTKLGFGLQLVAALLLLPIMFYNLSYWSVSMVMLVILSVVTLPALWSYHSGIYQRRVIQLLWVPMLFGLLLFIK